MTGARYEDDLGGGICVSDDATVRMSDCVLEGNVARSGGGGINIGSTSTLFVERCAFIGNQALAGGGGGLRTDDDADAQIVNSTFSSNHAEGGSCCAGGAMIIELTEGRIAELGETALKDPNPLKRRATFNKLLKKLTAKNTLQNHKQIKKIQQNNSKFQNFHYT